MSSSDYPASGDSVAPAIACAVVFLVCAILCGRHFAVTKFETYALMSLSGLFRCAAYAVRAVTVVNGGSTLGEAVTYQFLANAGYSMSLSESCLMLALWMGSARESVKPAMSHSIDQLCKFLFIITLCFGPGINIVSSVYFYGIGTPEALDIVTKIKEASAVGLLVIAASIAAAGLSSWALVAKRVNRGGVPAVVPKGEPTSLWRLPLIYTGCEDSDAQVGVIGRTTLLLVWAAVFKVYAAFKDPAVNNNETLYFTLEVLPEMLHLLTWCVPELFPRAALGSSFERWWDSKHNPAHAPESSNGDALAPRSPSVAELPAMPVEWPWELSPVASPPESHAGDVEAPKSPTGASAPKSPSGAWPPESSDGDAEAPKSRSASAPLAALPGAAGGSRTSAGEVQLVQVLPV